MRKSGYVTAEALRTTVADMLQREDLPDTNRVLAAFGFALPADDNLDEMLVRYIDLAQRCEVRTLVLLLSSLLSTAYFRSPVHAASRNDCELFDGND